MMGLSDGRKSVWIGFAVFGRIVFLWQLRFQVVFSLDVLYHRAKFGEDRTTRAGCIEFSSASEKVATSEKTAVGAKIWCLYVLCCFFTCATQ